MISFTLPSDEDTKLVLNCAGKKIETDLFDMENCIRNAYAKVTEYGVSSEENIYDLILKGIEDRYGIKMSKLALFKFLTDFQEELNIVKKKYSLLPNLSDSTDSPQDQILQSENEVYSTL
jgi:hypothetical protein